MTDFSFETDKKTYFTMKSFFEAYKDCGSGSGILQKGPDSKKECFQIKFMQHQSEKFFSSNESMYKVYIAKIKCDN
jgi:hypothetical protein